MNVKIYIGKSEQVQSTEPTSQIVEFVSAPTASDTISWDYYPAWPSTATVSTVTIPLLAIPSPYSNTQMASDLKSFITGTTSNFNATVTGAEVEVFATTGSPIFNVVISGSYATSSPVYGMITVNNFEMIDLFSDENIGFTSKLSDIEKLSNVFTDFTNSFTVPATPKNNELFRHYYDVDIDNTFNANIRVLAYLEIDSFPLRYGKLQLEGIKLKAHRPDAYKITFYGGLLQLSDLFGDDTINELDYKRDELDKLVKTWDSLSQFDYEYNETNFLATLNQPSFKGGNIITPLIAYADRDWNYGTNDATDISMLANGINETELRPALRVARIIDAIETKYGISFTDNFFGKAVFNNLYIWLNGNNEPLSPEVSLNLQNALTDSGSWSGPNINIGDFIQLNTANDFLTINVPRIGTAVRDFKDCEFWVRPMVYNLENPVSSNPIDAKFRIIARDYDTGEIVARSEVRKGNDTTGNTSLFLKYPQRNVDYTVRLKFSIELSATVDFDFRIFINMFVTPSVTGPAYSDRVLVTQPNNHVIEASRTIETNLPSIKVIDFFQGIMKMFKLIIRPVTSNIFYVNTLDGYYADGKILDITEYVDNKEVNIERPLIYKTISFQYEKTNNVLGKKFRETYDPINDEEGYGDLISVYKSIDSKEKLEVQLPFENMMFERMTVQPPDADAGQDTNITIGQSVTRSDEGTISPNQSKPILFFNNGIGNNSDFPFYAVFGEDETLMESSYLIGNVNDVILDQVTDSINWGAEIDPWFKSEIQNSLYLNYWSNWINTIYDLKQRKFTFETNLPPRFIEELSLNDKLVIGDQRYKINDYTVNLTTGNTKFTLFKDIYNSGFFPEPEFSELSFATVAGLYMSDYSPADSDGSYFLYGNFSSFGGATATRVIKLNADGTQDRTFLTNLGGPNSNPFALVTLAPYEDGRLLVGGFFTQYNGTARNRIARLNPNGSLDTSFSIGTGFNGYTEKLLLQDDGNILVTGGFSSYNGTTRNRLVRLDSSGTLDTTLSIGTGFNNVTLDAVQNEDGSYYVAGYFSQYNGATANHVVKIGATGAIDNTFTTGATAFSPGGNNRVIGLLKDPNSTSFWVYGYDFTTYKGATAGRIVKLNALGNVDPLFECGSAFNNSVYTLKYTSDGDLFAKGEFTTYDTISTSKAIILGTNGDVKQTFPSTIYSNHYIVGNDVWATETSTGKLTKLTRQNELSVTRNRFECNAGSKYFSFATLSDTTWSVSKVDIGWGTDWVDLLVTSGSGNSEVTFFVDEKASQTPPTLNQDRSMYLKVSTGNIEKWIKIVQRGL